MAEERTKGKGDKGAARIATIAAGAAIGSAAIAAAVLFATKRRDGGSRQAAKPGRMPPETD